MERPVAERRISYFVLVKYIIL